MTELSFPLIFEKCPACGSEETVAALVAQEEKAKGRMGEDFTPAMGQEMTPIVDPRRVLLSVTALAAFFDICVRCGCYYCRRVEKGQGKLEGMGRGPKGPIPFHPS